MVKSGFLAACGFAAALMLAGSALAQTETTVPTVDPTVGAFDALSAGNQKIVDSIYESQFGSTLEMGGGTILTKDEIAYMKGESGGWGNLYNQLRDQGYVTEKNLGQAVSSYNHQSRSGGEIVVTTGAGQQAVAGGTGETDTASASVTRGGGASHGGGKKLGHLKNDVVTTSAGGGATAGAAAHSNAGGGGGFGGLGGAKGRGHGGSNHGK